MNTNVERRPRAVGPVGDPTAATADNLRSRSWSLGWLVPVGRALFAAIFILSGIGHFSHETVGYAAAHGVPMAGVLVPISGVLAVVGGLSVVVGFEARVGAVLLVAFLVPVTLAMHRFWGIADPQTAMLQRVMFLKNLSMLGGALIIAHFGAGPLSVDARRRRASRKP